MAEYKHNSVNVTVLGKMNTQILTHDWLVKNRIINKTDFISGSKSDSPFSQFISTPPFTQLAYGHLVFTVEENKFVLSDSKAGISKTKIYRMVNKYFSLLPHTPLIKLGINVQGTLSFSSKEEENSFDLNYIIVGKHYGK